MDILDSRYSRKTILDSRYSRKTRKQRSRWYFVFISKTLLLVWQCLWNKDEISPTPLFSCFSWISRIQDVHFRNLFYFVFFEAVCLPWLLPVQVWHSSWVQFFFHFHMTENYTAVMQTNEMKYICSISFEEIESTLDVKNWAICEMFNIVILSSISKWFLSL